MVSVDGRAAVPSWRQLDQPWREGSEAGALLYNLISASKMLCS